MSDSQGDELPTYLFVELTSLDALSFPAACSTRIKYTCLDVSPRYVALGSTSGSVYLFSRYASKYRQSISNTPVQVISCKEGGVVHLKLAPDEKFLAVATKGFVGVLHLDSDKVEIVQFSPVHENATVTALCWSNESRKLFAGDDAGKLSVIKVSQSRAATYFKAPYGIILELDSAVVQLDFCMSKLLISTYSRTYLYSVSNAKCSQIGKKLRKGPYGACFYSATSEAKPIIFCCRPGSRIWEVDSEGHGHVYSTHQFGDIGTLLPQAPVASFRCSLCWSNLPSDGAVIHFGTIYVLGEFLLCLSRNMFYVISPAKAKVVLVSEIDEKVRCFSTSQSDVFMLTEEGRIRKFTLYPVEKALSKLCLRKCFQQCAAILTTYFQKPKIIAWPSNVVDDIVSHFSDSTDQRSNDELELMKRIQSSLRDISLTSPLDFPKEDNPQPAVQKLSTGIHKILKNPMQCSGYEDDFKLDSSLPIFRKDYPGESGDQKAIDTVPDQVNGTDNRLRSSSPEECSKSEYLDLLIQHKLTICIEQPEMEEVKIQSVKQKESRHKSRKGRENSEKKRPTKAADLVPAKVVSIPLGCSNCSLHRSWLLLLKLGHILPKVAFSKDLYAEGGIPATRESWRKLFELRSSLVKSLPESDQMALCSTCHSLCLSWFKKAYLAEVSKPQIPRLPLKNDPKFLESLQQNRQSFWSQKTTDLDEDSPKKSMQNGGSSPLAYPSRTISHATVAGEYGHDVGLSVYYNPAYQSVNSEDSPFEESFNQEKNLWAWLAQVDAEFLLAVMSKVVGVDEVLELLQQDEWSSRNLCSEFWTFLIANGGDENVKFPIPDEILVSLYQLVCRPDLLDSELCAEALKVIHGTCMSDVARVNLQGSCCMCTLPLKSKVSQSKTDILVFPSCGHAYHEVCLSEPLCVVCQHLGAGSVHF